MNTNEESDHPLVILFVGFLLVTLVIALPLILIDHERRIKALEEKVSGHD